ncbi:MFS transporter [candidate division KSB1 bacterium]|nr:MFS transporter [candidate division KSB1 bacterium]
MRRETDKNTAKHMRTIIYAQCAGVLGRQLFISGFMLAFLSKIEISSADVLVLLSLPHLLVFFLTLPFAYLADRYGKKFFGVLGLWGTVAGYFLLVVTSLSPLSIQYVMVWIGVMVFGIGVAFFNSSWFALLEPIIPPHVRGRFFGRLRFSWQSVVIVCNILITLALKVYSGMSTYRILLVAVTGLLLVRVLFYYKIPELEKVREKDKTFRQAFIMVLKIPGYLPFCAYTFLLLLFTGSSPWILGLLEKDILQFGEYQLVLMGNLLFAGSLLGFYVGGKMVDRLGTRSVFLYCHFLFGIILFLFLLRHLSPVSLIVYMGILTAAFGFVQAASSIAITSEMMALVPKKNKSLATSFNLILFNAGPALFAILAGKILDLNILNDQWSIYGVSMSQYDTLLLGSSIMIVLLVVTLGLIPSVIGNHQWVPRGE